VREVCFEGNLQKLLLAIKAWLTSEKKSRKGRLPPFLYLRLIIAVVGAKVNLFAVAMHVLTQYQDLLQDSHFKVFALLFEKIGFPDMKSCLSGTTSAKATTSTKPATAKPASDSASTKIVTLLSRIESSPKENVFRFQLREMGHLLNRKVNDRLSLFHSAHDFQTEADADPRVSFIPDRWQRKLLDVVDRYLHHSPIVVQLTAYQEGFSSGMCANLIWKDFHFVLLHGESPSRK
jgi:hypothetical protein